MACPKHLSFAAAALLLVTAAARPAATAERSADPCSMLPATTVSTVLGREFRDPEKSVAPRPYPNSNEGTDCTYSAKGAGSDLLFRLYVDPSASDATALFARLEMFYRMAGVLKPVSGLGNEAYFDATHGLHVRKGEVRYYLGLTGQDSLSAADRKQLQALATTVAGQV